jgi:hypothetical protein
MVALAAFGVLTRRRPTQLPREPSEGGVRTRRQTMTQGFNSCRDRSADDLLAPLLRAGGGAALEGLGQISTLGALYDEAIESAHQEADTHLTLAGSAAIVGMTQALDLDPEFKADVTRVCAGAGRAAAGVRARIDNDPGVRRDLQLRADRGFVEAAGYARVAAHEMRSFYALACSKLDAAEVAGSDEAGRLRSVARGLMRQAAETEKKYLAPVTEKARDDAAYGIGVQHAVYLALRAKISGDDWVVFDAELARARLAA